jgi:hypothetical protein
MGTNASPSFQLLILKNAYVETIKLVLLYLCTYIHVPYALRFDVENQVVEFQIIERRIVEL